MVTTDDYGPFMLITDQGWLSRVHWLINDHDGPEPLMLFRFVAISCTCISNCIQIVLMVLVLLIGGDSVQ